MSSDPGGPASVRVDSWLVAVRLVKTRSIAAQACKGGHVTINGQPAKPATPVAAGDRVEALLAQRQRVVEVVTPIAKRVGAPVAATCYIDHSPAPPPRDRAAAFGVRDRGAGRPSKKDRRQLDRLRGRPNNRRD